MPRYRVSIIAALLVLLAPQVGFTHGGVVEVEDLCVIKFNYLRGHFTVFMQLTDGLKEYC